MPGTGFCGKVIAHFRDTGTGIAVVSCPGQITPIKWPSPITRRLACALTIPLIPGLPGPVFALLILSLSLSDAAPVGITSASYSKKSGELTVKTVVRSAESHVLFLMHSQGGVLGQTAQKEKTFRLPLSRISEVPCRVHAVGGDVRITKTVAGAPSICKKVPLCRITKPKASLHASFNQPVEFTAKATLKDKKAGPLRQEWDFGGGAMGEAIRGTTPETYLRPAKLKTTVKFVRDNSRYRVRFTVWDTKQRYCEDSVELAIGTPPDEAPSFQADLGAVRSLAQISQQIAPVSAAPTLGRAGDWVVLPFQDWTMQTTTEAKTMPNLYIPLGPPVNNINAVVYEKARQPKVVDSSGAELFYAAASNPADPVGADSINSTSQNWPVGMPLQQATIQITAATCRVSPTLTGQMTHSPSAVSSPPVTTSPPAFYRSPTSTMPAGSTRRRCSASKPVRPANSLHLRSSVSPLPPAATCIAGNAMPKAEWLPTRTFPRTPWTIRRSYTKPRRARAYSTRSTPPSSIPQFPTPRENTTRRG